MVSLFVSRALRAGVRPQEEAGAAGDGHQEPQDRHREGEHAGVQGGAGAGAAAQEEGVRQGGAMSGEQHCIRH